MSTTHTYTLSVTQHTDGSGFATLADDSAPFDMPIAEADGLRPDDAVSALLEHVTFNYAWTDTEGDPA